MITRDSARILGHIGEAVAREAGIERNVGGAGLQDAEQCGQQLRTARERQADPVARADPRWRSTCA